MNRDFNEKSVDLDFETMVEELEEQEDMVECKECFDLFPKVDCIKLETGYICPTCGKAAEAENISISNADITTGLYDQEFPDVSTYDPMIEEKVKRTRDSFRGMLEVLEESNQVLTEAPHPVAKKIFDKYFKDCYIVTTLTNNGKLPNIKSLNVGSSIELDGAICQRCSTFDDAVNAAKNLSNANSADKAKVYIILGDPEKLGTTDNAALPKKFREKFQKLSSSVYFRVLFSYVTGKEQSSDLKAVATALQNYGNDEEKQKAFLGQSNGSNLDVDATPDEGEAEPRDEGEGEVTPEEVKFTVTFKDGDKTESIQVLKDAKVAKPADPAKENFEFKGWFNGEAAYDFETPVTADLVLEAKWEAKPAEADGGETSDGEAAAGAGKTPGSKKELDKIKTDNNKKFWAYLAARGIDNDTIVKIRDTGFGAAIQKALGVTDRIETLESFDVRSLTESVTISGKSMTELEEINRLCREIGIIDGHDLNRFMDEVGADDSNLIAKLKEYRAELGDDFEIEDDLTESSRFEYQGRHYDSVDDFDSAALGFEIGKTYLITDSKDFAKANGSQITPVAVVCPADKTCSPENYFVRFNRDDKLELMDLQTFGTFMKNAEKQIAEGSEEQLTSENEPDKKLLETLDDEDEVTVECTWCNELFGRDQCRYEVDLGWLCGRCEAAIKSRGETLTFKENNYWDFLDEILEPSKKTTK